VAECPVVAAAWAGCTKPKLVPANRDPLSRYNSEGVLIFQGALFILTMAEQAEEAFITEMLSVQRAGEAKSPRSAPQFAGLSRRRTFCETGPFLMTANAAWFTHVNAVHECGTQTVFGAQLRRKGMVPSA